MSDTTMSPPVALPRIFTIPREIRNQIYLELMPPSRATASDDYAIIAHVVIKPIVCAYIPDSGWHHYPLIKIYTDIMLTCKWLKDEYREQFWKLNKVIFSTDDFYHMSNVAWYPIGLRGGPTVYLDSPRDFGAAQLFRCQNFASQIQHVELQISCDDGISHTTHRSDYLDFLLRTRRFPEFEVLDLDHYYDRQARIPYSSPSASSKGITYIRRMSQILEILSLSLANKHIRQLRRKIVVIFEEESSKELLKKGKWVRNDTTPPWANLPGRFLATIEDAFKAEVWHNGHRLWGDFSPVPEVVDIAKLIEANEAKR
ncbi:hypothetical protein DL95DRAFT_406504 [Leptodontidium sp. 2 PMI_412]|nr:hypothetical protein DL95DRAFT_406504 [Leptodontidium sp. 2 PMI_412]